jgi:hypothetical protein
MFGSTKTTQRTKLPSYINQASEQAIGLGSRIGQQQYSPYLGQRVAGLSQNEQLGMERARTFGQQAGGYLEQAANAAGGLGAKFTDADMDAYMNPYIKGALDPAARDISEWTQKRSNEVTGMARSADAWSPSRTTLLQQGVEREHNRSLDDLYGRGRMEAFERGANRWEADQRRIGEQVSQYLEMAGMSAGLDAGAISNLMRTGAEDRNIRQAMADFDYQQFTEGRDWDVRNLQAMLSALQGTQGSYDVTQISKEKGSTFGQIVGLGATLAGAYMTGGASLALGAGAAAAGSSASGGSGIWNSAVGGYTTGQGLSGWGNADLFPGLFTQ